MTDRIRLYKNHKNQIGYWEIWSEDDTVMWQSASGLHHSPILYNERVKEGKQGRTVLEQVQFRIRSKINSKLDAGYVANMEDAKKPPTDAEGKQKPMLATHIEDYSGTIDYENSFIQIKYNGHRCLITKQNGVVFAYSRNGKRIPGIDHILSEIRLEEGQILDGELYRHGWALQRIASAAKKAQSDSAQLRFHCYDMIAPVAYSDRLAQIKEEARENQYGHFVKIVPTKRRSEIRDLGKIFTNVKKSGYEGLILRLNDAGYEAGRRSNSLLKIKKLNGMGYHDEEFVVLDVVPSKDKWGILVCQLPSGGTFKVSAPGSVLNKTYVLNNKDKFIGRKVKVEFPELTQDGIPFQPVALEWYSEL